MKKREKAKRILDLLEREFPGASTELEFKNPLELMVATILSAQATDKRVNAVTRDLFKKYPSAEAYASSDPEELETDVSSINFYRNKAKNIRNCCREIAERFGGEVPKTVDELVTLPGVGRKTANIVLGNAFGIPAIGVDTHVKRVSGRLGLTSHEKPDDIEKDLSEAVPRERWTKTTNLLILHGRKTCTAKKPKCGECPVSRYCDYYREVFKKGEGGN